MISMDEILMGRAKFEDLDKETQANLLILHERINKLRKAYGKPLKVNDGYRRQQDKPKNGAAQSKHFIGAAIDLDDDDSAYLWKWVQANLQLMKDIGLWMEDPRWTHGSVGTWMHFQIIPPKSNKRIYIPSEKPASAPTLWDGKYDSKFD
jgi:hypothetical protein